MAAPPVHGSPNYRFILRTSVVRDILAKYRASLYPTSVRIDLAAAGRVAQSLTVAGLLPPGAKLDGLYDTAVAGG